MPSPCYLLVAARTIRMREAQEPVRPPTMTAGEDVASREARGRPGGYRLCGVIDVTTPAGACFCLLLFLIFFQIFLEFIDEDDVHHHHYYANCATCGGGGPVQVDRVGSSSSPPGHPHQPSTIRGDSGGPDAEEPPGTTPISPLSDLWSSLVTQEIRIFFLT